MAAHRPLSSNVGFRRVCLFRENDFGTMERSKVQEEEFLLNAYPRAKCFLVLILAKQFESPLLVAPKHPVQQSRHRFFHLHGFIMSTSYRSNNPYTKKKNTNHINTHTQNRKKRNLPTTYQHVPTCTNMYQPRTKMYQECTRCTDPLQTPVLGHF